MFDLRNCGVSRIICVSATRWGPLLVLCVGVDWPWSTVTTILYPSLLWTRIIYSGRTRHFPSRCIINKVAKQPKETYQRQFTSVQFKWYLCALPRLSEVSLTLPLKHFQCSSDWRWVSLVLWRKSIESIVGLLDVCRQSHRLMIWNSFCSKFCNHC